MRTVFELFRRPIVGIYASGFGPGALSSAKPLSVLVPEGSIDQLNASQGVFQSVLPAWNSPDSK